MHIGNKNHLLEGVFNGKGYTISNLTMGAKTTPINHASSSTGDVDGIAGRNTGIGLMLTSFYNAEAHQKSGVKASSVSYNSVKLSWKTASKAKGYIVYRADSKNGDYEEVYATRKTSLTDTDLKTGKTYWYKVAAYTKTEYGTLKGAMSSNVSAKPSLAKVSNVKAKAGVKKATVSWKKVAGASGYKVYRSTKKSSGYKLVKTIKNSKQVKFTNEKLSKKKTYYYKVKAYRVVNGKNVYGDYSSVVKVNMRV